ncbi:F0F1 ATP synthase subunit A [Phytoactinopolyspora alkaliphila]|uniref:ATP synthase subunit a n=1 Tax=Phytoactinopolyspora alkaliphila TaxID=1783498 RepID=A0A6N9YSV4_9ACTN|nr:F0F1 ATP synthase subunit A [Phytoactinopolyspora alkaliphila]NED98121.1 F0F1 ATP synthase subunit A [Phytoactinopolyspora alkaliphila]
MAGKLPRASIPTEKTLSALTTTIILAAEDDGFHAPSLVDFFPPAILFEGTLFEFNRVNLVQLIMTVAVATFFIVAFRNPKIVPRGMQNLGEIAVNFVQVQIIDTIMGAAGRKYLPYLATLFFFILAMNIAGIIPFLNLAGSSVVAVPMLLAVVAWVTFNVAGIRKHGFGTYMKSNLFPPGVPKPVYVLLTPIEFLSTFILRPVTLTIRLLANMMAGHLMLVLFFSGATYLLLDADWLLKPFGLGAAAMGFFITAFEILIAFLQAYIFTLLTALYIAGAESESH